MDGALRMEVLARDQGYCLAPNLDPRELGECHNMDGRPPVQFAAQLEVDHVRPEPAHGQLAKPQGIGGHGKRPKDRRGVLATLCWWHHQGMAHGHVWALANRPKLRAYLDAREAGAGYWDAVRIGRLT